MTRKHFEVLARNLSTVKPRRRYKDKKGLNFTEKYLQWKVDVEAIALACHQFNPRFDWDKFSVACGRGEK